MQLENDLAAYYARRAAEYERIYAKPERQQELAALRVVLAQEFAGRNVLEVACGTGYWTAIIASVARQVHACDYNAEVLALAQAKTPPRTAFFRADAYALPVLPEPFDAALAAFWLSHVPKSRVPEFLAHFHSRLGPGARVVLVDNVYAEGSSTPLSRCDEEGNTYQLRQLEDGSSHEVLKNFPNSDELDFVLREGGARELQLNFGRYFWRASYLV